MGESTITEKKDTNSGYRMNLNWERVQSLIILILLIIIFFMQKCGGGNVEPIEPKIITKTETVWDTLEVEKKVYVPKWRTKVETKYDTTFITVNTKVDTLNILKDYYTKYVYNDTLFLDTLGYITLIDTITENKVLNRSSIPSLVLPTEIINNTIYINEREFYTGFGVRTNGNNISWMGLEGLYRTKKGNIFILGVGTDNQNKLSMGGGVHWRIGGK